MVWCAQFWVDFSETYAPAIGDTKEKISAINLDEEYV